MENNDSSKYASRKFMLATWVILAAAPMLYFKLVTGQLYFDIVVYTLGLYLTGNVAQDVGTKIVDKLLK